MLSPKTKLAIYMEGAMQDPSGKMGFGVLRYSPCEIVAVVDSQCAGQDAATVTDIPRSAPVVGTIHEARELGADVLVLGIAPPGGRLPDEWIPVLHEAVGLGFSLVNGLHRPLGPEMGTLLPDQFIWDIRQEPSDLSVNLGTAAHQRNRRVLTIGSDMAIGKMTVGLELYRSMKDQGVSVEFVATGQIGITIMGNGVPLDAVRVDFASGSVEREMNRCSQADVILIEGQGSLVHPGSTATLPLLRGSMPTHFIFCHKAGLTHLQKLPQIPIPPLDELVQLYVDLATTGGTFPKPKMAGLALNTSHLTDDEAKKEISKMEEQYGWVTDDVVRFGPDRLAAAILS